MYDAYMKEAFLILATRSCVSYAKKVVQAIMNSTDAIPDKAAIDYTGESSVLEFSDGEMEVVLHKSVRGRTVFLFTTSSRNEAGLPLEKCKIELYHTIDVLQRSHARQIIVFEPYISCSRSDRTVQRNSVGLWIHYKTMISLGANHLITYQLHSDKSKTFFDPCLCSIDDVPGVSLLQKYLCDTTIHTVKELENSVCNDWLFCSVDAGGEKLARKFASAFGTQLVIAHKQRNYVQANTVECINILSAVPLEGKNIWIVDDMIDTASSVYNLVLELSERAGREIHIMIIHPVLSNAAIERLQKLKKKGVLGRLVVCDTISCKNIRELLPFIEIIESADLSAKIIETIYKEQQMSGLIDTFSPVKYLESIEKTSKKATD